LSSSPVSKRYSLVVSGNASRISGIIASLGSFFPFSHLLKGCDGNMEAVGQSLLLHAVKFT